MSVQSAAQAIINRQQNSIKKDPQWNGLLGILFTFAIASLGLGLATLPILSYLGPMVTAILLSVLYRQLFGYPETIRAGVQFSAKTILRYAIILFGFRLNVEVILHQGIGLLVRDVLSIVLAISITMLVAKRLKANTSLSLLLAIGTGVCGAAAIAAVSPILKAKEEDTAISVGIIAFVGTIFTIIYTLLYPLLPMTGIQYGIWSGVSLHEIAHVAAAAAPAGEDPLAMALLAKLGRVLLLVPLCLILAYWMKKKDNTSTQAKMEFPWFLGGFVIASLIGTYTSIPKEVLDHIASLSSFLLTAAMVGLGLNVSFQALKSKGWKPLIAMLIASIILSVTSFGYSLI